LLIGSASNGLALQSYTDMQKIRIQMDQVRNRIITDTRRSYEQWKKAETVRDLSRMQLDLAREEVNVLLAQNGEGRVAMSRVEQARVEEADRWIAFYDSENASGAREIAICDRPGRCSRRYVASRRQHLRMPENSAIEILDCARPTTVLPRWTAFRSRCRKHASSGFWARTERGRPPR